MGICRNTFGKLSYIWVSKEKRVYSVTKGENRIIRHDPYIRTSAALNIGDGVRRELDEFNSFIRAVRFLKKNADDLL